MQRLSIGWMMGNEFEKIWTELIVADLSSPGGTEEIHEENTGTI
jgi:hypothetical protein